MPVPSSRVTVSDELLSDRPPLEATNTRPLAAALPKEPVGEPPPKTTAASRAGSTVPVAKTWRTELASERVQPLMSTAVKPVLSSSTNSSAVADRLPSPLASPERPEAGSAWISLITTWEKLTSSLSRSAAPRGRIW